MELKHIDIADLTVSAANVSQGCQARHRQHPAFGEGARGACPADRAAGEGRRPLRDRRGQTALSCRAGGSRGERGERTACECLPDRIADPNQLTFARYAHRLTRRPVEGSLVHIGDAWHAASPQLGQGANMALLDAWALAKALRETDGVAASLARFISLRRAHVRLYQWLTWLFTPLYQSESAFPAILRDIFLAPLSRVGLGPRIQVRLVAGLAGNPLRPLGLELPNYRVLSGRD